MLRSAAFASLLTVNVIFNFAWSEFEDPYRKCPKDINMECPGCKTEEKKFGTGIPKYCYLFSRDSVDQPTAKTECNQKHTARLAFVENSNEKSDMLNEVKNLGHQFWIGLEKDGDKWKWIDESQLSSDEANWGAGQPDRGTNQDCVMHCDELRYKWNDFECSYSNRYICKRSEENTLFCTELPNCEYTCCSDSTDQTCRRCEYNVGPEMRAYKLAKIHGENSVHCVQMCSWRSDSLFCFPGTCGNSCEPKNCQCAKNFMNPSNNCMDIARGPDVMYCNIEAIYHNLQNGTREYKHISCQDEGKTHVGYVNLQVNEIKLDMNVKFEGLNYTDHGEPYFVNKTRVGVISLRGPWILKNEFGDVMSGVIDCDDGLDKNSPITTHSCERSSVLNRTLKHKDRLEIRPFTVNGGYLILNNYDNGDANNSVQMPAKYFEENWSERLTVIYFDYVPPDHCSVRPQREEHCEVQYLNISAHFTRKSNFTVIWDGWWDDLAGIYRYELDIYEMSPKGDILFRDETSIIQYSFNETHRNTTKQDVILPSPGMYTFVLTVEDNTASRATGIYGNTRYARQFVLFDDTNEVEIIRKNDVIVETATTNTSHRWIINLDQRVTVNWTGRFCNKYHTIHKLLNKIGNDTLPIDPRYQDGTGPQPPIRTMQPIPNVCAVVKYFIQWRSDNEGGINITHPIPSKWHIVEPEVFQKEVYTLEIPRSDGDTIHIFIKGYDILNTTAMDYITVHVDSTPPEVEDISLCKDGFCGLQVHNSKDISRMHLTFTAYDDHSGLNRTHWKLHDAENTSVIHSSGWLAIERPQHFDCEAPNCTFVPTTQTCYNRNFTVKPNFNGTTPGEHEVDYYFWIHVTNNAMLHTVKILKVTIDISPPHPGSVLDSEPGTPDLDFQPTYTHHAHWQGFFDKESGVMFYQYGFSSACIAREEFVPASPTLVKTQDTFASHTWNTTGTYFITVVAYNHALDPSDPVCSDGLTIDITPPKMYDIRVEELFTRPGLAVDYQNRSIVYYVSRDRKLSVVQEPHAVCRGKGTPINASLYEMDRDMNGTISRLVLSDKTCMGLGSARHTQFMASEHKISVDWMGEDPESGVYDYQVSLSTQPDNYPDILQFQSSHSHQHFVFYHSGLSDGQVFYIRLQAQNRAGLVVNKVIGPCMVENIADDDLITKVNIQHHKPNIDQEYMLISWEYNNYVAWKQENILSLQTAIADSNSYTHKWNFMNVSESQTLPGVCSLTNPPSCVSVPVSHLNWKLHGLHQYYAIVRVKTVAGHQRDYMSDVYLHIYGPPTPGAAWEASTDTNNTWDIDIQTSTSELTIRWSGFHHPSSVITYLVHLQDPVVTLATSPSLANQDSFVFTNVRLHYFMKYSATVIAMTEEGNSSAITNGVTIIPHDLLPIGAEMYDGHTCFMQGEVVENATNEHHESLPIQCPDDVDFQLSRTTYSAHWNIPTNVSQFIKEIRWSVQKWDLTTGGWVRFSRPEILGVVDSATRTDLNMVDNHRFRGAVKFCHENGCLQEIYSDGFHVLQSEPVGGNLDITYPNSTASPPVSTIEFSWTAFRHPALVPPAPAMSHYEWSLMVDHSGTQPRQQLLPWQFVPVNNRTEEFSIRTNLDVPLHPHKCHVLVIKCVNHVGLSSQIEQELPDCHQRTMSIVVDAVGEWDSNTNDVKEISYEKYSIWNQLDQEFSPSPTTISAVWPSLRHGHYLWKVVSGDKIDRWDFFHPHAPKHYKDYHCLAPETMRCGETKDNHINVRHLPLKDGQRYFLCIFAAETTVIYERHSETYPEVSSCSDGVVVDLEPPTAGRVWMGHSKMHYTYQTETGSIVVRWDGFKDVERHRNTHAHTAIARYEVAIGSSEGAMDVKEFLDVGVKNYHIFNLLDLKQGQRYYTAVKAYDFVGRYRVVHSESVMVDMSPPDAEVSSLTTGGAYHAALETIRVNWHAVFHDQESGIDIYHWCLGTRPGHCDTLPAAPTNVTEITGLSATVKQGVQYFFSVQAINGAGLTTPATSPAVVIDQTSPVGGYVLDGLEDTEREDHDFQVNTTILRARWGGFHDPETGVAEYSVSVGACPTCADVLPETNYGTSTVLQLEGLHLIPGRRYFTHVRACNWVGGCVTVSSDGVVVDNSPPLPGRVFDGIGGEDIMYQLSRSRVCAHWYNFFDPHSGLSRYEWRVGLQPGTDDILAPTRVHKASRSCSQLRNSLPLGRRIYVMVRAVNHAGLWSESSSDGFIVDNTPPVVVKKVEFNRERGSLRPGTQVWRGALHVEWEMEDRESGIAHQFLSVEASLPSLHQFYTAKVYGDVREYIFANLTLFDGEFYKFKVIACNGGSLCTVSETAQLLVDHSPPTPGAFAVATRHAIHLERNRTGYMLYNHNQLSVAFLGFNDAHSDIFRYFVTVGTFYDGADLVDYKPVTILHNDTERHRDEGFVQRLTVTLTRQIHPAEYIYITIWAQNKVEMISTRLHGTFYAIESKPGTGLLDLNRRCTSQTCEGLCTCTPQDTICNKTSTCANVKGKPGFKSVVVKDGHVSEYKKLDEEDYTWSIATLVANWETTGIGKDVARYDWSVGIKGQPPGTGLIDRQLEPIWRDAGHSTQAVFTLKRPKAMKPLVTYTFYIRAWYDVNETAVYESDGIRLDFSPPEISKSERPVEVRNLHNLRDIDYITQNHSICVSWKYVFRDGQSNITDFHVMVGTIPGISDIASLKFPADVDGVNITGLILQEGIRYWTTVKATNQAKLFAYSHSDGFQVDLTPPSIQSAVVQDGLALHDHDHTSDPNLVSSRWFSFVDMVSTIHHHVWCVGSSPGGDSVISCKDVGLHEKARGVPRVPLVHGRRYFSKVKAVDGAGHHCDFVLSDGFVPDTTPPEPIGHSLSGDLLNDGSFEDLALDTYWSTVGDVRLWTRLAKDGQQSVLVGGSLGQVVPGIRVDKVKVIYWVAPVNRESNTQDNLGRVMVEHTSQSVLIRAAQKHWQRHVFYAYVQPQENFTLSFQVAAPGHSFLLDTVRVYAISHDLDLASHSITVEVNPMMGQHACYVSAAWRLTDPESGIVEYHWALGTVKGGVQIQTFKSVRTLTHAQTGLVHLSQGVPVFVTVTARNAAGLTTVVYAEPVQVDFTPPDICCLQINEQEGLKTSYLKSQEMTFSWSVWDTETPAVQCEWAVGTHPGASDIHEYVVSPHNNGSAVVPSLQHGTQIFTTIRCTNQKDLTATLISAPTVVVLGPPSVKVAMVTPIIMDVSQYEQQENHQAYADRLRLAWDGFEDPTGIRHYKLQLAKKGNTILEYDELATYLEQFCDIDSLNLQVYHTYTAHVTAVSNAGYSSSPVSTDFTVELTKPIITGKIITSSWLSQYTLTLDWTGVFTSNSSLIYEVNVGLRQGGHDVLRWAVTKEQTMVITEIDPFKEHFITVAAINKAGLYNMVNYTVAHSESPSYRADPGSDSLGYDSI